jgi:predicted nucleotidyltransferase
MSTLELAQQVADQLGGVAGVAAVVLGGSWARGDGDAKSDIDLGIYYDPERRPPLDALRALAAQLDDRRSGDAVTDFGEWGPWINGGAWLDVRGRRVDWLYRDLARVRQMIDECRAGRPTVHYQPGHPQGFYNHIYMGEVHLCRPLYDPEGAVAALKALTIRYPPALKKALVDNSLWEAGFSLENCHKSAARGDVLHVTGFLFRCAACITQALFALNERYCINEKGSVKVAGTFALCPPDFESIVNGVLGYPGQSPAALANSVRQFEALLGAVRALAG